MSVIWYLGAVFGFDVGDHLLTCIGGRSSQRWRAWRTSVPWPLRVCPCNAQQSHGMPPQPQNTAYKQLASYYEYRVHPHGKHRHPCTGNSVQTTTHTVLCEDVSPLNSHLDWPWAAARRVMACNTAAGSLLAAPHVAHQKRCCSTRPLCCLQHGVRSAAAGPGVHVVQLARHSTASP